MVFAKFPPGPHGSRIFGISPAWLGGPLEVLPDWARQYGDIVSWRTFHIRVYLLNHPEDIETVLLTHSRSFWKGRGLQANRELFGNGLLTSEGAFWLRQRRLPTPANRRYSRAVAELDRVVYEIIARRRAAGDAGDDLLARLLRAEDPEGGRMDDRQLRDECMTLLLAGHETTALALSWTAWLLAGHPEVQEKLHAETDAVLGSRAPSAADLPRLAYADRVLRESLRLYPPAWLMPRIAAEDCTIRGYRIRRGSSILLSQWIVHRDPRFFPEPDRFDPDRWTEAFARGLPRFAYFPFGGGPRLCIGNHFAMQEASLLLAMLVQRFRLRTAGPQPVEPLPTITLRPRGGVRLTLERRS